MESVCAGLWPPPRVFLAWLRPVWGPIWVPSRLILAGSLKVRRKLNLPVWPTMGMAQTGRLTHRYGIFRVYAVWVGSAGGFWGAERPKRQQLNPPILRKPGKSHIGGSGDRFEPYRWSAIRAGLVSADFGPIPSSKKAFKSPDRPHFGAQAGPGN